MPVRARLPANKTPWPMKWIVLAILLAIVPYTYLRLHFAKPGQAHEPYEEAKARAESARLAAGWLGLEVRTERPADIPRRRDTIKATATATAAPGDCPPAWPRRASSRPTCPRKSPPWPRPGGPFAAGLRFSFRLQPARQQAGARDRTGFLHDNDLVVVPQLERLTGELLARSMEATLLVTVPGGSLKPGRYTVTVVASTGSKQWPLEVK